MSNTRLRWEIIQDSSFPSLLHKTFQFLVTVFYSTVEAECFFSTMNHVKILSRNLTQGRLYVCMFSSQRLTQKYHTSI